MPCRLSEFFQVCQVPRGWVGSWAGARPWGFGLHPLMATGSLKYCWRRRRRLSWNNRHSWVDCPIPIKWITWKCQKCDYTHRKASLSSFFPPCWSNLGTQWTFPGAGLGPRNQHERVSEANCSTWEQRITGCKAAGWENQGTVVLGLFSSQCCISKNCCRC